MGRKTHSDLVVVRHQPGLRLRQFLILLFFSVAAGAIGFVLGMLQADFLAKDAAQTRSVLSAQVERLRDENHQLKQQLLKLERGGSIDKQAIREAQRTIKQLQSNLSQVNSDLGFYKDIMAPGDVERSLQVQRMRIQRSSAENVFGYKLSLTQVGDNRNYIEGQAMVSVIGQRGGKKEILPLRDLSATVEKLGITFRFRYFQDIEGELVLPEGFKADAVQVVAQAEGKKGVRIERTFEWRKLIGE